MEGETVKSAIRDILDGVYSASSMWTPQQARRWKDGLPWLMGCNFTPSSAINPIEMWDAATFDAHTIDRELGLAAGLGMNVARVYLHNIPWKDDRSGFLDRISTYLRITQSHGIRTMMVLFDSCWHPEPSRGPQPQPVPGVHNSGWVQCPGMSTLMDVAKHDGLKDYVRDVVGRFANDPRILAWDVWNEPDNGPEVSACDPQALASKADLVAPLLRSAFGWARGMRPIQPLTSGIWLGDWSAEEHLTQIQRDQVGLSDVITFHNYDPAAQFEQRVEWLSRYDRPLLCTEFMARPVGSTFDAILPIAKKHDVGAFCWGLVSGKTQTRYSWDSWKTQDPEDAPWFHDVLRIDGTPYDRREVDLMREMTGMDRLAA
jgi:hypothetical protein